MGKKSINTLSDTLLTNRFMVLLEKNIAKDDERDLAAVNLQLAFMKTLTPEQQEIYSQLDSCFADQEAQRCETFYRAGIKDGLSIGEVLR